MEGKKWKAGRCRPREAGVDTTVPAPRSSAQRAGRKEGWTSSPQRKGSLCLSGRAGGTAQGSPASPTSCPFRAGAFEGGWGGESRGGERAVESPIWSAVDAAPRSLFVASPRPPDSWRRPRPSCQPVIGSDTLVGRGGVAVVGARRFPVPPGRPRSGGAGAGKLPPRRRRPRRGPSSSRSSSRSKSSCSLARRRLLVVVCWRVVQNWREHEGGRGG